MTVQVITLKNWYRYELDEEVNEWLRNHRFEIRNIQFYSEPAINNTMMPPQMSQFWYATITYETR